jgi:hypothetical protein
MLHGLLGKLVSAQVIVLPVMLCGDIVGMRGKPVELRGPLV